MQKPETFESLLSKEGASVVLTPAQRLFDYNLAQWCAQAVKATRFCTLCDWPLDPWWGVEGSKPLETCTVCVAMESILYRNQYWLNMEKNEKARRKEMGLD